MKSSEEASPSAPWNHAPMTTAQPPSYAEATHSGVPYPMQMPQPMQMPPYPVQQQPPYPVQQHQPYPISLEIPVHSQTHSEGVQQQQYQTSQYGAPVVNHPPTHVQHIVTVVPQEQTRGCGGRNRGIGIILGFLFGFFILGAIVKAIARGY